MNIFITKFFIDDRPWYSSVHHLTKEEATFSASVSCQKWNDGTTFEIIEYTPVSNSDE